MRSANVSPSGVLLLVLLAACNDGGLKDVPIPPDARIAGNSRHSPLDEARFSGERSSGEEAPIVDYAWSIVARPAGSTSSLAVDPTDPRFVSFPIDLAGAYRIRLTVTDSRGLTGTDELPFDAVPWQAIHVELSWDTGGTDVDLHLVNETDGGSFFVEPFDCYFENTNPDWGEPEYRPDDPSIDLDDTDGYGPENVNLALPQDDHRYLVLAHLYRDVDADGSGTTTATVRIYLDGELRYETAQPMSGSGTAWEVAAIDWPAGSVTGLGRLFDFPR